MITIVDCLLIIIFPPISLLTILIVITIVIVVVTTIVGFVIGVVVTFLPLLVTHVFFHEFHIIQPIIFKEQREIRFGCQEGTVNGQASEIVVHAQVRIFDIYS